MIDISSVLPNLPVEKCEDILIALRNIGASKANIHLLKESDLTGILPLLQARQLLEAWGSLTLINKQSGPIVCTSNISSSIESLVEPKNPEAGWAYKFAVPWESFPKMLLQCCAEGKPLRIEIDGR